MAKVQEVLAKAGTLEKSGQLELAALIYIEALQKDPSNPIFLYSLGVVEEKMGNFSRALELLQKALAQDPSNPVIMLALQVRLFHIGELEESQRLLFWIIERWPTQFALAHHNLGAIFEAKEELPEAIASYSRAIALDPTYVLSHYGMGFSYGKGGDLQRCWQKMLEAFRMKSPTCHDGKKPWWNEEDVTGKTLLICPNGGIGDYFQFFRYLKWIAQKDVTLLLQTYHPSIMGELITRNLPQTVKIYTGKEPFDVPCLISHLGLLCQTTIQTVPQETAYLKPHPFKLLDWKKFFQKDLSYKVGIVWKGNPSHANDHHRSMDLAGFAPLQEVKGCTFYGLQKGNTCPPPKGLCFVDLSAKLRTFDDTAAIIACLDLVIAVDTSTAHLAGALGKPVWMLLGFHPDYRWMLQREGTPWYPTMRLFRSKGPRGWEDLMQRIKEELHHLVMQSRHLLLG